MLNKDITFEIEFDSSINKHISTTNIFEIVQTGKDYYILGFNQSQYAIKPKNLTDEARDFLDNITPHFATLYKDTKNNNLIISVNKVFNVREISKMDILVEQRDLSLSQLIRPALGASNAMLAYQPINQNKDEQDNFLIKDFNTDTFYKMIRKSDFDKETNIENVYYYAERIGSRIFNKLENFQANLLVGTFNVVLEKKYISISDKMKLDAMKMDVTNYINLWQKYNEIELKSRFVRFINSGYATYSFKESRPDGVHLFFSKEQFAKLKKLGTGNRDIFYVGKREIVKLFNAKDFEVYKKTEVELLTDNAMHLASIYRIFDADSSIIVRSKNMSELDIIPNNNGVICLSLLGDKIAHDRRETAKNRILNGKAGIHNLYTWFTNNPKPCEKKKKIPIDYSLFEKDRRPTINQEQAIDIILNTPDIAIIQGPPGTGKTTVIRESLKQINSKHEAKYEFGNNLLTGYRQETVNNLISGTKLFGLPALKIENNQTNESKQNLINVVRDYTNELTNKLIEKYGDLKDEDFKYVDFFNRCTDYRLFDNTIESTIELLVGIKKLEQFNCDNEVLNQIDCFIKDLKAKDNRSILDKEFLNLLYRLPMYKEALDDDYLDLEAGFEIFQRNEKFAKDCKEILNQLNNFDAEKMTNIRRDMIVKYLPENKYLINKVKKKKIVDFLDKLCQRLEISRIKEFDGYKLVILEFIRSLEENPQLVQDTILDYAKVLASTNQYAISKEMFDLKEQDLSFNNVFIDEAATSSPLDLFIPMSIADKKIILVGDQAQLPNITDEDIVEEIKKEIGEESKDEVDLMKQETLFEKLISIAANLEKIDGVKRFITLNTQFRMHPALGKIVSDNFYNGIISSPLPAEMFEHNYHNMKGRYIDWINIPYDDKVDNSFYRRPGSKTRQNINEAQAIINHIIEARKTDTESTIGVITLFKDQANLLNQLIREKNLEDNKIMAGTVDAFQGREFDIVYLSLVYVFNEGKSYSRLNGPDADSLLCVALSRQKKMLFIVGDMNVYGCELAKQKVNKLYNICELCRKEGWYE